ncbi:putative dipeptidase [Lachnellula occidentalis]|uniref:Dipeptidase n=1 Tax=Lachnellula occidentalis TaxID=215460 RepID=A0A8H8RIS3_9HELO|nr:putative dipeptidase [Lachnellula occidentalis]
MEPHGSTAGDGPTRQTPRYAMKITFLLMLLGAISAIAFPYLGYSFQGRKIDALDYEGRVKHILDTTPLIDGHNDLPYLLRIELQNKIYDAEEFNFWDGLASHTDLKRLQEGRIGGQFWSVFVECPDTKHFDDPDHAVRDTIEQIDVAKRLFAHHSTNLTYCTTSSCAISSFKSGRIASMLGAEGLHQAGSALASIRQFFLLGVRYITLTHNCDNAFATAASTVTAGGKDNGLTQFGYAAVKEMNRLGMMVDLSHVSHESMRDVLRATRSPVMFSHSACYALARSYRNVPDDVLRGLRENGGVVMVMFVKRFLNAVDPESADMQTAVDHIFHVANTAGWEHVGIGADFDGTITLADGIDDVTAYPRLIQAVMGRGATDEQVRGLVGENILRVWRDNEMNAAAFEAAGELPVEDVWAERRFSRWDNPLPLMLPGNKKRVKAENYI